MGHYAKCQHCRGTSYVSAISIGGYSYSHLCTYCIQYVHMEGNPSETSPDHWCLECGQQSCHDVDDERVCCACREETPQDACLTCKPFYSPDGTTTAGQIYKRARFHRILDELHILIEGVG